MTQTHAEAKAPAAPALSAFLPAGYAEVSRRAVAVDGVPAELVRQSMRRSACTAG